MYIIDKISNKQKNINFMHLMFSKPYTRHEAAWSWYIVFATTLLQLLCNLILENRPICHLLI